MIEKDEVRRDFAAPLHEYAWLATHVALLVAAGWTILFIGALLALTVRFGVPPVSWALVLLCSIWLGLVALSFWGQRNSKQRLKAVTVDEAGLWFGSADEAEAELVPWGEIESVQAFSYPDRDAMYMHNKSGLRLSARGRRFFIYEHIDGYAHLVEQVESKASVQ